MNKEPLMITGAAGFIASSFWFQFEHKYKLFGVDRYSPVSRVDERYVRSEIWQRDCSDVKEMELAIQRSGALKVLHMASSTHNDTSLTDPLQFYRDNVMGTASVLEAARRQGVERVYVVVTDEVIKHMRPADNYFVYDGPLGFDQHTHKNRTFYRAREMDMEWTFYNPTSPYSSSKACQEMIVNAYRKSYGMDIVVIRPTNVYGPGQYPEKLISKGITDLLNGKKVQVYGEGLQWRDYTYVSDTCDALDLILSQEKPEKLYHIAANDERQNLSTVKEILKQLDKSEDFIEYIEDPRKGAHDYSYSLSSARIRNLGWAPKVEFSEGISRTIQYYKDKLSG